MNSPDMLAGILSNPYFCERIWIILNRDIEYESQESRSIEKEKKWCFPILIITVWAQAWAFVNIQVSAHLFFSSITIEDIFHMLYFFKLPSKLAWEETLPEQQSHQTPWLFLYSTLQPQLPTKKSEKGTLWKPCGSIRHLRKSILIGFLAEVQSVHDLQFDNEVIWPWQRTLKSFNSKLGQISSALKHKTHLVCRSFVNWD